MPNPYAYALSERLRQELREGREYLDSLPSLKLCDIPPEEESCPICLNTLVSIIEEGINFEQNRYCGQVQDGSRCTEADAEGACTYGVVKLEICGHIFCRRDLSEWVDALHGTCPTCRATFFNFTQYSDADLESSDGGEYLPEDDDVEMEDEDEELEEYDEDEVDYGAFPSSDHNENDFDYIDGGRWRPVVDVFTGARSRVFRRVRDMMSVEGTNTNEDGDDEEEGIDWMEEDTAHSSSVGDLTEGSDAPTSEELSSNIEDNELNSDDVFEINDDLEGLEHDHLEGSSFHSNIGGTEGDQAKSLEPSV